MNIRGFYDAVVELSAAERKALPEARLNEKGWAEELSVNGAKGEEDYTTGERCTSRATLGVNCALSGVTV